ncbi:MAG TPA: PepSY domain-containing protein [Methylosinus sp.]|uniref:PepSY domain-containing protein n=1 Tax=Methylosinus sp. TaxID=427 RepID=UPI002F946E74
MSISPTEPLEPTRSQGRGTGEQRKPSLCCRSATWPGSKARYSRQPPRERRSLGDLRRGHGRAATWPGNESEKAGDVIDRWLAALHMAAVFGPPMKILVRAMGMASATLSISGGVYIGGRSGALGSIGAVQPVRVRPEQAIAGARWRGLHGRRRRRLRSMHNNRAECEIEPRYSRHRRGRGGRESQIDSHRSETALAITA